MITRRRHFLAAAAMVMVGAAAVACAHFLRLPPREVNLFTGQLAPGQAVTAEGPA